MKRLLCLMVILLGVAACRPVSGTFVPITSVMPTATVSVSSPVPPVTLTPPQLAAMSALSESAGIPLENIAILSTDSVDWPDSCLGVIHVGFGCADAITPGFKIVLEAHGLQYEYHTNREGTSVTAATLVLTWHREGGIAGFCDDLQVYLSGEVYGSSCKSGDGYPVNQLTASELAQLVEWVQTFGPVQSVSKDPAVADAMTLQLSLNGRSSRQPTEAEKSALLNWAQTVYDKVKPCC